jgi:hypothetical protein
MMKNTIEYRLISEHYGDRTATRSGVRLMNHIDEGLIILDAIIATEKSKRAFCLHPLLQTDQDLKTNLHLVAQSTDPWTMMLAMEYRNTANAYLSDKIDTDQPLKLSPLFEVNEMLIADKVQNKKDFMKYHFGKHDRSNELFRYFNKWLDALAVDNLSYQILCERIEK